MEYKKLTCDDTLENNEAIRITASHFGLTVRMCTVRDRYFITLSNGMVFRVTKESLVGQLNQAIKRTYL